MSSSYSAADPEWWAALRQRTIVPGRDSIAGRVALEGGVVHVSDIRADPDFAVPETVAAGVRTALGGRCHVKQPKREIGRNRRSETPTNPGDGTTVASGQNLAKNI